jgi:hypothetical protein
MRRHVQRMGSGRRDLGVALRRIQTFVGDGGIVVEMDQVVCDARVPGLALEDRLQDRRALELVRIGLIVWRCCDVEGDRIADLGLVVLGIPGREILHRLQVRLHAAGVRNRLVVRIEDEQGVDVVPLALRLGAERLALLQRRETEREVVLRRRDVRVHQGAERDAPVGDGAAGIGLERLAEDLRRLAVPERVLVAHGAVEPPLRRVVARRIEVNRSESPVAVVLSRSSGWWERGDRKRKCGSEEGTSHHPLPSWLGSAAGQEG